MTSHFYPNQERPRPVFIVGVNGSGTSMLVDSLGRHPELYSFPTETRLIPYLIASARQFHDLSDDDQFKKLWNMVLGVPWFTAVNGNQRLVLPAEWRSYPRTLEAVLDAVYRNFAARVGKQRWCEKSPQNVQSIPEIAEVFPLGKFIHVIRDGRNCAASTQRRFKRRPEFAIYHWKKLVREGQGAGGRYRDRYLELRYEDITAEPESHMRQICGFLELPYHCDVLESKQPWLSESGDHAGLVKTNPRWPEQFSAGQIERCERIAGAMLHGLGYANVTTRGDADPPRATLFYWRLTSFLRRYIDQLVLKFRGESGKSWRLVLQLPLLALRELRQKRH